MPLLVCWHRRPLFSVKPIHASQAHPEEPAEVLELDEEEWAYFVP